MHQLPGLYLAALKIWLSLWIKRLRNLVPVARPANPLNIAESQGLQCGRISSVVPIRQRLRPRRSTVPAKTVKNSAAEPDTHRFWSCPVCGVRAQTDSDGNVGRLSSEETRCSPGMTASRSAAR